MAANIEDHDRRNTMLRLVLGTAGALVALLIAAAVLRPDLMMSGLHGMMAMLH